MYHPCLLVHLLGQECQCKHTCVQVKARFPTLQGWCVHCQQVDVDVDVLQRFSFLLATRPQADRAQRQTASQGNQTSLFDSVLDEEGAEATGGGRTDGRSRQAAPAAKGASSSAFPFASAAKGAASAARKSHLDVGTAEERRRLEREAFRVSVHEHIRKELVKTSIEDSRALAANGRC